MSIELTKEDWEKVNMTDDDNLILQVLKHSPKIDAIPFSGRNFYDFFESLPEGKDAAFVYPLEGTIIAVYKYGRPGDSGYRMFGCENKDAIHLRRVIESGIGSMFQPQIGKNMLDLFDLYVQMENIPTLKKSK